MNPTKAALGLARAFAGIDGDHHKAWVIDQMVRVLTGDEYEDWIAATKLGDDGPESYEWDVGIPP